jgi:N-acetylmuramoyl-L-alanine amidase
MRSAPAGAPHARTLRRAALLVLASVFAAVLAFLALPGPAPAQREGGDAKGEGTSITVLLPEGQERSLAVRRFEDGGEYVAAGDIAAVLRATSYWRSETRKLLLRIGDHRLTVTAGHPFVLLDGNVSRWPDSPRHADGQVWLPVAVFDLLATARVLPDIRWDEARRELALSPGVAGRDARAAARRAVEDSLRRAARGVPDRPPLVILDPGHGGEDMGSGGASGQREKHLTLELASRVRRHLEAQIGARVLLVRERDERVEVPRRVEIANSAEGDLLVSIHFDLSATATGRTRLAVRPGSGQVLFEDLADRSPGAVTASEAPAELRLERWDAAGSPYGAESYALAQQIAEDLGAAGGSGGPEVVRRPVWNLEGARMPAVAIEVGAPRGGATALGGEALEGLARGIALGINHYWRGESS